MKTETLAMLPDWPALMDYETTVLYLGGSKAALERLEEKGLTRWQNGHRAVRFLRAEVDAALQAIALQQQAEEERKGRRRK